MKCFTIDILVCIAALSLSSLARNYIGNKKGFNFDMPEYSSIDQNLYDYDDITDEDVW